MWASIVNDVVKLPLGIQIGSRDVNGCFNRLDPFKTLAKLDHTSTNTEGIYLSEYAPNTGTKLRAYCVMVQGKLPLSPGKHKWWEKWVVDRKELGESTRKRSAVVVTTKAARNEKRKTPTPRQGLRPSSNSSASTTLPANSVTPTSSSNSYPPEDQNYWRSGLATKTFGYPCRCPEALRSLLHHRQQIR
jgi:hypothetical protein